MAYLSLLINVAIAAYGVKVGDMRPAVGMGIITGFLFFSEHSNMQRAAKVLTDNKVDAEISRIERMKRRGRTWKTKMKEFKTDLVENYGKPKVSTLEI